LEKKKEDYFEKLDNNEIELIKTKNEFEKEILNLMMKS
jgi:hypothetical protein